jgi:hypothetical protein
VPVYPKLDQFIGALKLPYQVSPAAIVRFEVNPDAD